MQLLPTYHINIYFQGTERIIARCHYLFTPTQNRRIFTATTQNRYLFSKLLEITTLIPPPRQTQYFLKVTFLGSPFFEYM
jgi:hypothetical protein